MDRELGNETHRSSQQQARPELLSHQPLASRSPPQPPTTQQEQQQQGQQEIGQGQRHQVLQQQQQEQNYHQHHRGTQGSLEPDQQQQKKKSTKHLTPEEKEYWQQRLPAGFQFYLERLARGVIRNQPTNIQEFAAVYLEELLVNRNAELWKLPEEPYFAKLFKSKLGYNPWLPRRHRVPPRKQATLPIWPESLPDTVAFEYLPHSSQSPARISGFEATILCRQPGPKSSTTLKESEEGHLTEFQNGLGESNEMLTALDCGCNPTQRLKEEVLLDIEAENRFSTPSACSSTSRGISNTSFDTADDTQTSTMGGQERTQGVDEKMDNLMMTVDKDICPVFVDENAHNPALGENIQTNSDLKDSGSTGIKSNTANHRLTMSSPERYGAKCEEENVHQSECQKIPERPSQMDRIDNSSSATGNSGKHEDEIRKTSQTENLKFTSSSASDNWPMNTSKAITQEKCMPRGLSEQTLTRNLQLSLTEKTNSCPTMGGALNPCQSRKLEQNGTLRRSDTSNPVQCRPSTSECDALIERAAENGVEDIYVNTYDHVNDSMHQTKYFQSGLSKDGILIVGRCDTTQPEAADVEKCPAKRVDSAGQKEPAIASEEDCLMKSVNSMIKASLEIPQAPVDLNHRAVQIANDILLSVDARRGKDNPENLHHLSDESEKLTTTPPNKPGLIENNTLPHKDANSPQSFKNRASEKGNVSDENVKFTHNKDDTILETEYPEEIENKFVLHPQNNKIAVDKSIFSCFAESVKTTDSSAIHSALKDKVTEEKVSLVSTQVEEMMSGMVRETLHLPAVHKDKQSSPDLAVNGASEKAKPDSMEQSNVSTMERIAVDVVEKITHGPPEFVSASLKTGTDATASGLSKSKTFETSWEEDENDTIGPISDFGNEERSSKTEHVQNIFKRKPNDNEGEITKSEDAIRSAVSSQENKKLTPLESDELGNEFMMESEHVSAMETSGHEHTHTTCAPERQSPYNKDSEYSTWSFPTTVEDPAGKLKQNEHHSLGKASETSVVGKDSGDTFAEASGDGKVKEATDSDTSGKDFCPEKGTESQQVATDKEYTEQKHDCQDTQVKTVTESDEGSQMKKSPHRDEQRIETDVKHITESQVKNLTTVEETHSGQEEEMPGVPSDKTVDPWSQSTVSAKTHPGEVEKDKVTLEYSGHEYVEPSAQVNDHQFAGDEWDTCKHLKGKGKTRAQRAIQLANEYIAHLEKVASDIDQILKKDHTEEIENFRVDNGTLVNSVVQTDAQGSDCGNKESLSEEQNTKEMLATLGHNLTVSESLLEEISFKVVDMFDGGSSLAKHLESEGDLEYRLGNVAIKIETVKAIEPTEVANTLVSGREIWTKSCVVGENSDPRAGLLTGETITTDVEGDNQPEIRICPEKKPLQPLLLNQNFSNNIYSDNSDAMGRFSNSNNKDKRDFRIESCCCVLGNTTVSDTGDLERVTNLKEEACIFSQVTRNSIMDLSFCEWNRNINNNGNTESTQPQPFNVVPENLQGWAPKSKLAFLSEIKDSPFSNMFRPKQSDVMVIDGKNVFPVPMETIGQQKPPAREVGGNRVVKQAGTLICEQQSEHPRASMNAHGGHSRGNIHTKSKGPERKASGADRSRSPNSKRNTVKTKSAQSNQSKGHKNNSNSSPLRSASFRSASQRSLPTRISPKSATLCSSPPRSPLMRQASHHSSPLRSSHSTDLKSKKAQNETSKREKPQCYRVVNATSHHSLKGNARVQSMLVNDACVSELNNDGSKTANAEPPKAEPPAAAEEPKRKLSPFCLIKHKRNAALQKATGKTHKPSKSATDVACRSKSKSSTNQIQDPSDLNQTSAAVMKDVAKKPQIQGDISSTLNRALFGDGISLPEMNLEKKRARNAKRTPLVKKLEEKALPIPEKMPTFRRSDFPMRVHEFAKPNEANDYIPDITRRLTIESPEENLMVHTTYVRPNPHQPDVRGLFEVTSQKRRLYLGETEDFINTEGTRRLICETECFASKDPDTRSLVIENGTLRITHANVNSAMGDSDEIKTSSKPEIGGINEGAKMAAIVSNVAKNKTSLWYKNNYVRMVGDYVMIGGARNLSNFKEIAQKQRSIKSPEHGMDQSSNAILPELESAMKTDMACIRHHHHHDFNDFRSISGSCGDSNTNSSSHNSNNNNNDSNKKISEKNLEVTVREVTEVLTAQGSSRPRKRTVLRESASCNFSQDISCWDGKCQLPSSMLADNTNNNSSNGAERVSDDIDDTTLEDIDQIPTENSRLGRKEFRSRVGPGPCVGPCPNRGDSLSIEMGDFQTQVDATDIKLTDEAQTGSSLARISPCIPKRNYKDIESRRDHKFIPAPACEPPEIREHSGQLSNISVQANVIEICPTDEVQTGYPKEMKGHLVIEPDLRTDCHCPMPRHEKRRQYDTQVQVSVCDISPSVKAQTGSSLCLNLPFEPGDHKRRDMDDIIGHAKRFNSAPCDPSRISVLGSKGDKLDGQMQVEATDINPTTEAQTGESMMLTEAFPPPKPEVTDDFSEGPEVTWGDLSIYEMGPDHRSISSYAKQFDMMLAKDQDGRVLYPRHYKAMLHHDDQKRTPTGYTHTCFPPGNYQISPSDKLPPIFSCDAPAMTVDQPVATRIFISDKAKDHESAGEASEVEDETAVERLAGLGEMLPVKSLAAAGAKLSEWMRYVLWMAGSSAAIAMLPYLLEGDRRQGPSGLRQRSRSCLCPERPRAGPSKAPTTPDKSQQDTGSPDRKITSVDAGDPLFSFTAGAPSAHTGSRHARFSVIPYHRESITITSFDPLYEADDPNMGTGLWPGTRKRRKSRHFSDVKLREDDEDEEEDYDDEIDDWEEIRHERHAPYRRRRRKTDGPDASTQTPSTSSTKHNIY